MEWKERYTKNKPMSLEFISLQFDWAKCSDIHIIDIHQTFGNQENKQLSRTEEGGEKKSAKGVAKSTTFYTVNKIRYKTTGC